MLVVLLIAAFFGVCGAYARWCDRIIEPDAPELRRSARARGAVVIATAVDYWIGLGLAVLLTAFLVVVLVRPEKF